MLLPMLASLADAPLDDPQLVYEPKYDGIRAIVEVGGRESHGSRRRDSRPPVHLWSRLGNEKTRQFPQITAALQQWARRLKEPVVLDGEIVALDEKGEPAGFQQLQRRGRESLGTERDSRPRTAFIAFDVLRVGRRDLRDRPLTERRLELERLVGKTNSLILRISEQVRGDGGTLYKRALAHGWEGLIAKQAQSQYRSGKRTPDWRKIKIVHEQEFVIGGWTEPRQSRAYFGALLLGVYENGDLVHAGHIGTGFDERELARVMKLLKPLETRECPFRERPKTNERPHWVRPALVAQVKFTEWTADGRLRHPVYLGLRDDKKPTEVRREERVQGAGFRVLGSRERRTPNPEPRTEPRTQNHEPRTLVDQLHAIEESRRDGVLNLPDGDRLAVTNLHKIFWPKQKLTKGDLFRYYVRVADNILPAVADRPLVMKRYPNGINAQPFYQHRVGDLPPGVRVETVKGAEARPQIIGGNLKTLLYTTQLAAISQDPWFSRVQSPRSADYVAIDLDPSEGVSFAQVLDVARWVHDELEFLDAMGVPKTSGARGLHVYIPLPPGTPYDTGLIFCQIIATAVAHKHPKAATIERAVRARGKRVYVDCLQNIAGKTLATAYSARASEYAGVSTPVTWREVERGFKREAFTIETAPDRIREVGDLWKALRESKGIDLSKATRYDRTKNRERRTKNG